LAGFWRGRGYDGPERSHNAKFSTAFFKKKQTYYAQPEHFS
jgi:hypothetical protein